MIIQYWGCYGHIRPYYKHIHASNSSPWGPLLAVLQQCAQDQGNHKMVHTPIWDDNDMIMMPGWDTGLCNTGAYPCSYTNSATGSFTCTRGVSPDTWGRHFTWSSESRGCGPGFYTLKPCSCYMPVRGSAGIEPPTFRMAVGSVNHYTIEAQLLTVLFVVSTKSSGRGLVLVSEKLVSTQNALLS